MGGLNPEHGKYEMEKPFNNAMSCAKEARIAVNTDPGAHKFEETFRKKCSEDSNASVESQNSGFNLNKISLDTQKEIKDFGVQMKNGTYQGKGAVEFTAPNWSRVILNGKQSNSNKFSLDAGTLSVRVYAFKQDGFDNPNAPLRIESKNSDGSVDDIVIERPNNSSNSLPESVDPMSAKGVDKYIEQFSGDPKALLDSANGKPHFDALVKNWATVSDATVSKVKLMISAYARDNHGVNLQYDMKLMATKTKKGELGLKVDWKEWIFYNSGEV